MTTILLTAYLIGAGVATVCYFVIAPWFVMFRTESRWKYVTKGFIFGAIWPLVGASSAYQSIIKP